MRHPAALRYPRRMLAMQMDSFGRPLSRVLRDTPVPQGSEVLVKVHCCGVCHSDVHLHDGYFRFGDDKYDLTKSIAPPRVLGHEIVGTVIAAGPDAQVEIGARRVIFPWIGCGACSLCKAGQEHICGNARALGVNRDGGFADHVLVPHARYLVAFDGLPETQACTYACAGLTAYSALKKVSLGAPAPGAGDAILIIGAGGVGLSALRLARELFRDARIVVAEIDAAKWDLARAAGADETIDPAADGAGRALVKSTGGGVAAAIDFVGATATFGFGLGAVRKGGRLITVGLFGGSASVGPALLSMKSISILGSYVGSLDELRELLALAGDLTRRGALPELPVGTRPLAEASEAIDALREGRVRGRTVLLA